MRIAYYEDADNQTGRTIREVHHVTAYSNRYLIADDIAFDFGEAESELTVALNQLLFEGYYFISVCGGLRNDVIPFDR